MYIDFTQCDNPSAKVDPRSAGFGELFTDHIFSMKYDEAEGWHHLMIRPFEEAGIDPNADFEGFPKQVNDRMKVFRRPDGKVQLFRPLDYINRFNYNAKDLGLPEIDSELLMEVLTNFVKVEEDFVPSEAGTSLLLRMYLYEDEDAGDDDGKGKVSFVLAASPVAELYENQDEPITAIFYRDPEFYVPHSSFDCQRISSHRWDNMLLDVAKEYDCQDAIIAHNERAQVNTTVKNLSLMYNSHKDLYYLECRRFHTNESITAISCIEIIRSLGGSMGMEQGQYVEPSRFENLLSEEDLDELWGVSTEAGVVAINKVLVWNKEEGFLTTYPIRYGEEGKITKMLKETLTGIQYGTIEDKFGWTYIVE